MDMSSGVFFVATGDRCRREAAGAARFVARTNPGCAITVFTDDAAAFAALGAPEAQVVVLPDPQHSYVDKILGFFAAPYERNVFLDTDAFLAGDVEHLFQLLDRFDVAAAHAPGRSGARFHAYESAELPPSFPQLNTGVVAFRRTPVVKRAIERWAEIYAASPHHLHDQPAFRQAVYESGLAVSVLPPEWNALWGSAYYSGPVQVLHEHGQTEHSAQAAIDRLNAFTGPRVVTPTGMLLSDAKPTEAVAPPAPPAVERPARIVIGPTAPPVQTVPTRADIPGLLNQLGLVGTGVEVGVKEGKYSAAILAGWRGRLLISVDPWLEAPPGDYVDIANVPQTRQEEFLAATRGRLAPFGERSEIWRMLGDEAAHKIPDGTLDFVYLDARHDYASVKSDIEVWFPKVKPGGILAGHDYIDGNLPEGVFGVRSAVDEFVRARGLTLGVTTNEPATFPSWMVAVPAADAQRLAS